MWVEQQRRAAGCSSRLLEQMAQQRQGCGGGRRRALAGLVCWRHASLFMFVHPKAVDCFGILLFSCGLLCIHYCTRRSSDQETLYHQSVQNTKHRRCLQEIICSCTPTATAPACSTCSPPVKTFCRGSRILCAANNEDVQQ